MVCPLWPPILFQEISVQRSENNDNATVDSKEATEMFFEKCQKGETKDWVSICLFTKRGESFLIRLPRGSLRHFCKAADLKIRLVAVL